MSTIIVKFYGASNTQVAFYFPSTYPIPSHTGHVSVWRTPNTGGSPLINGGKSFLLISPVPRHFGHTFGFFVMLLALFITRRCIHAAKRWWGTHDTASSWQPSVKKKRLRKTRPARPFKTLRPLL